MSVKNERCPKCGEKTNISAFSNNPDILQCCACNFKGNRGAFETFIPTVFDSITTSPEVLAEKFVYLDYSDIDGGCFCSTILGVTVFNAKEEAIVATVARLKEVENESR